MIYIEKPIQGYDGDYTITEDGTVTSYKYKTPRIMKTYIDSKGRYVYTHLCKDNISEHKAIHRLVAEAFIPNPDNLPEVDHIDNNPQNNHVSNLRWCTRKFNLERSYETMSPVRNYKITELYHNDELVGTFKSTKLATRYAAKYFGVSQTGLEKYRKAGNCRIVQIDVTTIENLNLIEHLE